MPLSQFSRLISTGSALPSRCVTNDELARELASLGVETSDEWIRSRTGIETRYLVSGEEGTLSLAVSASRAALEGGAIDPATIDLVIVATTTPDEVFPAVACRLQSALGIPPCAAFDIQAVCSGFAYAVSVADSMIRSGAARRALVVGAESFSRLLDWRDRTTCVLFGDGAGAAVLDASDKPGILMTRLTADGGKGDYLAVPGRLEGGKALGSPFLKMDGRAVFREAVESLSSQAEAVLREAGVAASDIDLYVPHQANVRIMDAVASRIGVNPAFVVKTVFQHGNTCAASVPLALDYAVKNGMARRGDTVLLQGVGAGMTCGTALLIL